MKRLLTILILFFITFGLYAQTNTAPVIRIEEFSGTEISQSELSTLEKLVSSYIAEFKFFRIIDSKGQEEALNEMEAALSMGLDVEHSVPLSADYIVSGNIGKIGETFIFSLDNTKVSTGEKISVSNTADSLSDIVISSRSLTRKLFGKENNTPIATNNTSPGTQLQQASDTVVLNQNPTLSDIIGSWKGDNGIETVRILSNGTGLAVFSGGGSMKIAISISENSITIAQNQANSTAMYRSSSVITYDMAKILVKNARPMKWIFNLTKDGNTLSGKKESTAIKSNGKDFVVDNNYEREAVWTKISH